MINKKLFDCVLSKGILLVLFLILVVLILDTAGINTSIAEWKTELKDDSKQFYNFYSQSIDRILTNVTKSTSSSIPTSTEICLNDGDINEDGKLTSKDALLTFKYVLGKESLTSCQQDHADVNADGKITVADSLCIFKAVLNNLSPSETLSCEDE